MPDDQFFIFLSDPPLFSLFFYTKSIWKVIRVDKYEAMQGKKYVSVNNGILFVFQ